MSWRASGKRYPPKKGRRRDSNKGFFSLSRYGTCIISLYLVLNQRRKFGNERKKRRRSPRPRARPMSMTMELVSRNFFRLPYDYDSTRIHDTAQSQVHDTAQSRSQYWTGRYHRNNRMAGCTIMTVLISIIRRSRPGIMSMLEH